MTSFFLPISEVDMGAGPVAVQRSVGDRLPLAGGAVGFRTVRTVHRDDEGAIEFGPLRDAADLHDPDWLRIRPRIIAERQPFCGVPLRVPALMGIVNVTPDSFSDGGLASDPEVAARHGRRLVDDGAAIVDFGGESTRPGAAEVSAEEEIRRVIPAIDRFRDVCPDVPVSIDTRKARVARRALAAGAGIINDVTGLVRDPEMVDVALESEAFICVMHAQGEPAVMQRDPRYRSALLDVYEWLEERVSCLLEAGIPRGRIAVDPGIGFGKTFSHNMEIFRGLALFHGLGCNLLVGASRKRFLSKLPGGGPVESRLPGSVAAALHAAAAGAHILRVHDVAETAQALCLWRVLNGTGMN